MEDLEDLRSGERLIGRRENHRVGGFARRGRPRVTVRSEDGHVDAREPLARAGELERPDLGHGVSLPIPDGAVAADVAHAGLAERVVRDRDLLGVLAGARAANEHERRRD